MGKRSTGTIEIVGSGGSDDSGGMGARFGGVRDGPRI
jgi:hypothetical protein